MSAVERVEYMDNQKSAVMTETIQREKKLQRAYLQGQEAAGTIKPYQAPQQHKPTSLIDSVGLPSHLQTLNQDPIQQMNTSISKNMWTSNPGYLIRDGPFMASRFKQDFVYDQEESTLHGSQLYIPVTIGTLANIQLEYMRKEGWLDKKHNRRRDSFSQYVEAAAKSRALMGKPVE